MTKKGRIYTSSSSALAPTTKQSTQVVSSSLVYGGYTPVIATTTTTALPAFSPHRTSSAVVPTASGFYAGSSSVSGLPFHAGSTHSLSTIEAGGGGGVGNSYAFSYNIDFAGSNNTLGLSRFNASPLLGK